MSGDEIDDKWLNAPLRAIEEYDYNYNHEVRSTTGPHRMSWPVDPDTTRRLEKLRYVDVNSQVGWFKRLLRWMKAISNRY